MCKNQKYVSAVAQFGDPKLNQCHWINMTYLAT